MTSGLAMLLLGAARDLGLSPGGLTAHPAYHARGRGAVSALDVADLPTLLAAAAYAAVQVDRGDGDVARFLVEIQMLGCDARGRGNVVY